MSCRTMPGEAMSITIFAMALSCPSACLQEEAKPRSSHNGGRAARAVAATDLELLRIHGSTTPPSTQPALTMCARGGFPTTDRRLRQPSRRQERPTRPPARCWAAEDAGELVSISSFYACNSSTLTQEDWWSTLVRICTTSICVCPEPSGPHS